jgi:L-ribulose-5-phosphate 3-epimerase
MTSRREFIKSSVLAGAGLAIATKAGAANSQSVPVPFSINIFSKNLQWLNYSDMAKVAAEIGFEGIDLTVRPNGHVEPARVADDLPKAVEAIRKAGIHVPMITTGILSATETHTEQILKVAGGLGIGSYRMGWLSYDPKISIDDNLKKFEEEFLKLEVLNKKYKIRGEYQNHSGAYLGSAVWDVAGLLKKCDPKWMGLQYDVLHATVEGANAWPLGLTLANSHVTSLPIKDFQWAKKGGKWATEIVPLGQGMVDFTKFFGLLKSLGIDGPFSMHFEYPLGGVENGATTLTIDRSEVVGAMKRDLIKFRQILNTARIR